MKLKSDLLKLKNLNTILKQGQSLFTVSPQHYKYASNYTYKHPQSNQLIHYFYSTHALYVESAHTTSECALNDTFADKRTHSLVCSGISVSEASANPD